MWLDAIMWLVESHVTKNLTSISSESSSIKSGLHPSLPLQLELCQKIEDETSRLVIWSGDKIVTTLIYYITIFFFAWVKTRNHVEPAWLQLQHAVDGVYNATLGILYFLQIQCVFSYTATNSITLDTVEVPGPIKQNIYLSDDMQHPVLKDLLHPKIQPQGFCSWLFMCLSWYKVASDQQDTLYPKS